MRRRSRRHGGGEQRSPAPAKEAGDDELHEGGRSSESAEGKKTEEGEPKDGDKAGDPHHDGPNDWKNSGSWGPTPGCPDRVPREDEEKPAAAEGEDSRKDAKDSDLFLQVTPVVEAPVVEVKDNSRTKNVGATENVLRLPKKREEEEGGAEAETAAQTS